MKKLFIYPLLASILFLSACSTDLDVTGNYKETLIVYGLLDQSQSTQYIKINKAFLGARNAVEFAKTKDSTQFLKPLNVKLIRLSDNAVFILRDTTFFPKDAGIFYGPDQTNVIYYLKTPVIIKPNGTTAFSYDSIYDNTVITDGNYRLIIRNGDTGVKLMSQTSLVGDVGYTNLNIIGSSASIKIIDPDPTKDWTVPIKWDSGKNTRTYQTIIRFNYIDSTSSGAVSRYLDWVFARQKTVGLGGGEKMSGDFKGKKFMQFIGTQLSDYPGLISRKAGLVEILLIAGGEDLNTFLEVNAPSTGLIQERPEYTNIINGLGIFSSRFNKHPVRRMMDGPSLTELMSGEFTKDLKFK